MCRATSSGRNFAGISTEIFLGSAIFGDLSQPDNHTYGHITMERGEIRLKNETLTPLDNYVLTRGVPLPPGAVTRTVGVSIVDARGRTLPSNAKILQRRQDGSVEWMLMDILPGRNDWFF